MAVIHSLLGRDPVRPRTKAWQLTWSAFALTVAVALMAWFAYLRYLDQELISALSPGSPRNSERLRSLVEGGANPRVRGRTGLTPLMLCSIVEDGQTASWFIRRGVDVNEPTPDGATALAFAVWTVNPKTVKLLLSEGADPNAGRMSGESNLALALHTQRDLQTPEYKEEIKRQAGEVVSILKAAGAR